MFLRDAPTSTLRDIRDGLDTNIQTIQRVSNEMSLDLTGEKTLSFTGSEIVIPMDNDGITALGNWLEVPNKFLMRIDAELQQTVLTNLLTRAPQTGNLIFNNEGLQVVRDPNQKYYEPYRIIDRVLNVLPENSPAVDFWSTSDEFRLDVIVPEGFDRGIGGDPAVGDISRGGVRVGQDVKHSLAPWVQPFQYRLWCTNGMDTRNDGLKVDARGASVEEVLAEFEVMADRAFRQVEGEMEAFYRMREERVENPERVLMRLGEEHGLPARTVVNLASRMPASTEEDGSASMFDIVNVITNAANDPAIRRRQGVRRTLESVGGSIVSQHADRCGHCSSKLA